MFLHISCLVLSSSLIRWFLIITQLYRDNLFILFMKILWLLVVYWVFTYEWYKVLRLHICILKLLVGLTICFCRLYACNLWTSWVASFWWLFHWFWVLRWRSQRVSCWCICISVSSGEIGIIWFFGIFGILHPQTYLP